jgi:hypothetical protein
MKSIVLDVPMFGFVVATRAALGVGVGLLLADRLPAPRRRVIGRILVAIGAITTIPAARTLRRTLRDRSTDLHAAGAASVGYDYRLVGAERFPRKGDDDIG